MAETANVYVRNKLTGDIHTFRKLPDGRSDLDTVVGKRIGDTIQKERISLPGPEVSLEINAPKGMETKGCYFKVTSGIDLDVSYSRTHSKWTMKIAANDLEPETPLDVNVEVGEDEPDD